MKSLKYGNKQELRRELKQEISKREKENEESKKGSNFRM